MGVTKMTDDTIVVVFCSNNTAKELISYDPKIKGSLVASDALDDDEIYLVAKDEFMEWLNGTKTKEGETND